MQNVITTQFTNLGATWLQNLQQAQVSLFRAVVAPLLLQILLQH